MSEDVAIEIKNVSKNFVLPHEKTTTVKSAFTGLHKMRKKSKSVQHALRDVSFQINKGEFFGIVGRNGSGKSTLLKMLAGIYQPTHGSIVTHGKLVPFIELGVGFNPELTGRENVYLNGAMMGFSPRETDAMYDDIVAFAELEDFMDQKLKNYSSGMQVRLAFSVAIKAEADILLVDEVLAVGDADFQRKCYQYFKSLKKNKKTVVFVSHDMNAVREYCDRVVLIDNSKVVAEGKAEKISQAYLHLFNEGTVDDFSPKASADDLRWGNKWAQFQSIDFELTTHKLIVDLKVAAKQDIEDVVYGFRVRSSSGDELLGTNSYIRDRRSLTLRKGDEVHVRWDVPNVFSDGQYFIEPSIVVGDGATVCDWWNEAAKFKVVRQDSTSYPVTPDIKFTLQDL